MRLYLIRIAAVLVLTFCAASSSFGDVVESNDYGVWHVFGGVGKDGKSLCRLGADIAAIPSARIGFTHVADSANLVFSLHRDVWNAPEGTRTEVQVDFGTFHHLPVMTKAMDATGMTLASYITSQEVQTILGNLVAEPKIHFRGNEPDWTIPFPRQGEPVADFVRCLQGQQHTQPF